jgi:polyisoprenoid-binding protein YceI
MKNKNFLFLALSIVLALTLIECKPSQVEKPQTILQKDSVMPLEAPDTLIIDDATLIADTITDAESELAETSPINENKAPATKTKPVEKETKSEKQKTTESQPAVEAKPVIEEQKTNVEPAKIEEEEIVEEPNIIEEQTPVEKPIPFISSGFKFEIINASVLGTSSLHDWESAITEIEGKGSFLIDEKTISTIQDVQIKISVKGIKSEKGKKMDDKTYDTFKSEKHPYIIYTFKNAEVKRNDSNDLTINAAGNLSMAGTSKPVSLSASGKALPNGHLKLTVSKKLKMTDFNMEPPEMFLGTIKVGNEITVHFDFELSKLN